MSNCRSHFCTAHKITENVFTQSTIPGSSRARLSRFVPVRTCSYLSCHNPFFCTAHKIELYCLPRYPCRYPMYFTNVGLYCRKLGYFLHAYLRCVTCHNRKSLIAVVHMQVEIDRNQNMAVEFSVKYFQLYLQCQLAHRNFMHKRNAQIELELGSIWYQIPGQSCRHCNMKIPCRNQRYLGSGVQHFYSAVLQFQINWVF